MGKNTKFTEVANKQYKNKFLHIKGPDLTLFYLI